MEPEFDEEVRTWEPLEPYRRRSFIVEKVGGEEGRVRLELVWGPRPLFSHVARCNCKDGGVETRSLLATITYMM